MATNTPVRLTDQVKRWVTQVLKEDHAQNNEKVIWDVSVAVFPDPAATDPLTGSLADPSALVPLPTLVIYLEIPGADPDTSLYIAPIVAPFQADVERIRLAITGALADMRDHRQALLDSRS